MKNASKFIRSLSLMAVVLSAACGGTEGSSDPKQKPDGTSPGQVPAMEMLWGNWTLNIPFKPEGQPAAEDQTFELLLDKSGPATVKRTILGTSNQNSGYKCEYKETWQGDLLTQEQMSMGTTKRAASFKFTAGRYSQKNCANATLDFPERDLTSSMLADRSLFLSRTFLLAPGKLILLGRSASYMNLVFTRP